MRIVSIVGARPQFIKLLPIAQELARRQESGANSPTHLVIHTGQHYDYEMSQVFFNRLGLPNPQYHLDVGAGSHGQQTGRMLERIEEVLLRDSPDLVIVYGDTNSTLAGSLAAAKLHILSAHVEAGLRSFNRDMPEETNRVVSDHTSDILFCPSKTAVENLRREGFTSHLDHASLSGGDGAHGPVDLPVVAHVGDVMYDALLTSVDVAAEQSRIMEQLSVQTHEYLLATVHRAENTDNLDRLQQILSALSELSRSTRVIVPLHPRTRKAIDASQGELDVDLSRIEMVPPVDYLDMLWLTKNARAVLTDSGGVQKECYWLRVPCITLRDETEWSDTVECGANVLAGANHERIVRAVHQPPQPSSHPHAYGDGRGAQKILDILTVVGMRETAQPRKFS